MQKVFCDMVKFIPLAIMKLFFKAKTILWDGWCSLNDADKNGVQQKYQCYGGQFNRFTDFRLHTSICPFVNRIIHTQVQDSMVSCLLNNIYIYVYICMYIYIYIYIYIC